MFKPIANPYIVGNPIKSSAMFFGRQDDFDFIKRKLESGQKSYIIVLCGERRSGKTSILFQILSGCLGESFIPVLIDMQAMAGLKNDREFFEKFANETLKCIDDKIDIDTYFKKEDSSYKGFSAFLQEIHRRNPQKHILFLVDEYELIESKISEGSLNENLIPYLAGLLEGEQLISFLFTGSTKLEDRDTKLWQILFAKSLFRNVSYLSRDDSLRLITEPVKDQLTFETEVLNLIFRLTWGQPFYTQVVCQNTIDYVNEKKLTQLQLEDLEVVISEILENPLPQMIYFWNSLSDDKKLVMSLLAEILEKPDQRIKAEDIIKESNQRKFGLDLTVKSINMTLEGLFHSQYVSKAPGGFNFQMDLFRRWIKRDHAIWRVMKEVSALGLASSVVGQVYNSEASAIAKQPKKWLIPLIVVLLAVFIGGWWLLKPGSGLSEEKLEAQSKTGEATPEKELLEGDKKGVSGLDKKTPVEVPAVKKKAEIDRPPKTIKKTPGLVSEKKETIPQKRKEGEKVNSKARLNALDAKNIMLGAFDRAKQRGADVNAPDIFSQARQKENSANTLFAKNNFKDAKKDYDAASAFYNNALEKISKNELENKTAAVAQKNYLQKIKQKLTTKHTNFESYKTAQQEETDAENLFTNGNYKQATLKFTKAANDYSQAISYYEQQGRSITNIINNYLDGIQNESIAQMKKYYPQSSPELEQDWQQLFDYAENLKVGRNYKTLIIDDQNADVDIDVSLIYDGSDKQSNLWKFNLKKSVSSWVIMNVGQGN